MTYKRDLNVKLASIDWSMFDVYDVNIIHCYCGQIYSSHCKGLYVDSDYIMFTRQPCPGCDSQHNVRRAESQPESWTV